MAALREALIIRNEEIQRLKTNQISLEEEFAHYQSGSPAFDLEAMARQLAWLLVGDRLPHTEIDESLVQRAAAFSAAARCSTAEVRANLLPRQSRGR